MFGGFNATKTCVARAQACLACEPHQGCPPHVLGSARCGGAGRAREALCCDGPTRGRSALPGPARRVCAAAALSAGAVCSRTCPCACSKTALRLLFGRIKLLSNKKEAAQKLLRREIADLCAAAKMDSARIRVRSAAVASPLTAAASDPTPPAFAECIVAMACPPWRRTLSPCPPNARARVVSLCATLTVAWRASRARWRASCARSGWCAPTRCWTSSRSCCCSACPCSRRPSACGRRVASSTRR